MFIPKCQAINCRAVMHRFNINNILESLQLSGGQRFDWTMEDEYELVRRKDNITTLASLVVKCCDTMYRNMMESSQFLSYSSSLTSLNIFMKYNLRLWNKDQKFLRVPNYEIT
ncbi:hypothetical protein PPL_08713 [Heterostelium album PN500]|uniref:Uncharacterized protein n=1 Tax=Heterostelium pallidum (strain ATCC 26659 / Pp 5 / PN500) TaxID=670386 RepID=D3BJI7_HETP5|nr:hypothetical protein PPL_08713 [Heterostelium album PN500]EFA78067.1 hypothetical protein PPL_08713 [Heterostelium album PN500]|eukprot:XP_020430194.1 hypothetical protein PPL_08713 [Heterostelium album PN500]